MELKDIIGYIAAALTTFAFLPQVIRTWKSRSAKDLSYGAFILLGSGVVCWLAYGILIEDLPLIISNAIVLTLSLSILVMKIRFE